MRFPKLVRKWSAVLSLGVAAPFLSGCELTPEELAALQAALGEGNLIQESPAYLNPEPSCFADRFVQPQAIVRRSVDLLFVTDTSGSLNEERSLIARGIDSFVAALPEDVNYRIAVMLGHGSRSCHMGALYSVNGVGPVLDSAQQTLDQTRSDLEVLLTRVATDRYSDGGEENLFSLFQGIHGNRLAQSQARGFFRDDAALAVVFIADENDICAEYPAGILRVYDPDRLELSAKARDCAGVSPNAVLTQLRNLQGDRPLLVAAITYGDPTLVPVGGENEVAYGINELVEAAEGLHIDLASTDSQRYQRGLAQVGELVTRELNLSSEFRLGQTGIDVSSLEVQVNGEDRAYTYDEATGVVRLTDLQSTDAGATVDLRYCLPVEISNDGSDGSEDGSVSPPSPSPTPTSSPVCSGFGCGGGLGV